MKCPHCEYEYDWHNKEEKEQQEFGKFFRLPIELVREEFYARNTREVFGCPKCNKVFMEHY